LTRSELIDEVVEGWDLCLKTLSLSGVSDDLTGGGTWLEWITVELLPMIKHALWEGTTGSGGTESLDKTEGLSDWQEGLDHDEWGTSNLLLTLDNTTTLGHATVDTTYSIIWGLDFDQEDWFLEAWLGGQLASVEGTSHGWGDLTTTSVDSISVEGDILNVEADTSHVLLSQNSFLGGPLEGSLAGVLDFIQELALLGGINEQVSTGGFWTEAPDLHGIIWIPLEFVLQHLLSDLDIHLWGNFLILDSFSEFISQWGSSGENSVVLVW